MQKGMFSFSIVGMVLYVSSSYQSWIPDSGPLPFNKCHDSQIVHPLNTYTHVLF